MDAVLLHQAATQAKTSWLEQSLITLLPQIWNLTKEVPQWQETASAWAAQIDRLLEQKRLITPSQQKNRRTDIANALRTINPQHPAIPFVLLPSEIYTAINNEQANRLNARENKFFSIQQANELVERAIALLDSDKPDEVAAGLAVLVGRRIGEILISQFKPKTAYSLLFSEAVKRRGETGLEFEIPTLAPAEQILQAIDHLKQVWNIADLKALNLPNNHLKRRINARYSGVPAACRQHYADLVPGREAQTDNGERLYTHLFRAVYAEIATYYYKPDWIPDHRFKAEIQGHFKLSEHGQKIPNYSARQNYDDYLIRDRASGYPGVKLKTPGVQLLEVFQKDKTGLDQEKMMESSRQLEAGTINALLYRAVDRLLFSQQWVEVVTGLALVTGREIKTLLKTNLQEKTQFSIELDGLELPTLTGASQVVTAWKRLAQLTPLPISQVQSAVQEVCDRTFQDLAPIQSLHDLRAVYSAISLHWFCPPDSEELAFLRTIGAVDPSGFATVNGDRGVKLSQRRTLRSEPLKPLEEEAPMLPDQLDDTPLPNHEPKSKLRHRRKMLSVDAALLRTAAATCGIEIRGKGGTGSLSYEAALTQLLSQIAQGQTASPVQSPTPPAEDERAIVALTDQAKTLAWLTGRLEALEQQVEALKQERDQAIAQANAQVADSELEQLYQENDQLRRERDQAMAKLQAFKQLLVETGAQEEQEVAPANQLTSSTLAPKPQIGQPTPQPSSTLVQTPSDTIPANPTPKSVRKRIPEDDALQHIRAAVRAIMHFNDQQAETFDDRWYISFPVVQTLLRANGLSANQKNVATVFEELQPEMDEHHDKHAIGSRHNRRHPDVEKIVEKVKLELP
jgi:hypothetical protein